jgi:hypothetical protein
MRIAVSAEELTGQRMLVDSRKAINPGASMKVPGSPDFRREVLVDLLERVVQNAAHLTTVKNDVAASRETDPCLRLAE